MPVFHVNQFKLTLHIVPILDRYLLKEVLLHWAAVSLILWVVLISNRMARYLGQAAAGDLPGEIIFTLLGLKSVIYLVALLPLGLYLGILLALGRLYQDSEMAAMAACGVGTRQLYRPLLALGLVTALLLGWLSLAVSPQLAERGHGLQARAEQEADLSALTAGRFTEAKGGRLVLYVEKMSADRAQMERVFLQGKAEGELALLTAERARTELAEESGARFLVLEQGHRYQGFPGEANYKVMSFGRHGVRMDTEQGNGNAIQRDALPTAQLWASSDPHDMAELQWRLATPLAALVLVVLAVPMSRTTPRKGRYGKLLVAVLAFIIYYNLLSTAQVWVARSVLPPVLGIWWVHLLPVAVAGVLLWRQRPRGSRGSTA